MRLWFAPSLSCRNWTQRERASILQFCGEATLASGPADADIIVHIEKSAFLGDTIKFAKRNLRPWNVYVSLEQYTTLGPSAIEI
jgi:hypothetical protein